MVSFLVFLNMRLNKRKNNQKIANQWVKRLGGSVLLVALSVAFIAPASINARNRQISHSLAPNSKNILPKGLVLQESRGVRSNLNVNKAKKQPDLRLRAIITAYTSTPDQTDDTPFIAATGKRVYDGMIAANGLPFGTKIKIPSLYGEKIFTVDDRMNSRYGLGRMDIWLDTSRSEAMQFGLKIAEAEVYYPDYRLSYR